MTVYQVPNSKASIRQNQFEFKMPDGKKYNVPLLQYIKPSLALEFADVEVTVDADGNKVADMHDASVVVKLLFETYFPDLDLFAQFEDSEQFGAWMQAWTDASGVTLGESEASPKS